MRPTLTLLSIYIYALLSSGTTSRGDDRRWLVSLVDLVELDYEDHCEQKATAMWSELTGNSKGLSLKLERDKAFGIFARDQTNDIKAALTVHALGPEDDVLRRKVKLLLQPGDTLLDTEPWIRLVTFGDTALHNLRYATDYDCGVNRNCTLRELHKSLATQQDEQILQRMKQSWDKKLPDLNEYEEKILPLLRNASKDNGCNNVEEYWDYLGEYEGGIQKARELWDNVKPLYLKLHKYVTLKLKGVDAVGKPLPVHLLRSLTGDDWSNLIESLLPKHPDIYQKVHANLQLKNLGGLEAFKEAAKLIKALNLGEMDDHIWNDYVFNATCPATLVDWCKPNKVRAISCKDINVVNYMDAHETVMKIKYKEITALHSNNTYILREANRYSAVYEAIPGFASLLALDPYALHGAGLYSIERFNFNPNHHRLVLQLITALRDLPRLNYYLAADEWRLTALMDTVSPSKITKWSDFRKNFSMIETSDIDVLGDPYILFNKPHISKFMGLILKYQIYQTFAEGLMTDESNLVQYVADNIDRIKEAMTQGYGVPWTDLIEILLAYREKGLDHTGITDYYRLLEDYLDIQLDPAAENNEIDDYVEPTVDEYEPEGNEIPSSVENVEDNVVQNGNQIDGHENIAGNIIDTGDESNLKFGTETSTVGVLEIKNPVSNGDQGDLNTKEASYNTYWWIGIAVALAVVVVLIAIIARKRHNHRKQLEKQRRENSHA